jgi:hypothetical protein
MIAMQMSVCIYVMYVGSQERIQKETVPLGATYAELFMVLIRVPHKDWLVKDAEMIQIHVLDVVQLATILEILVLVKLEMVHVFVEAMNSIQSEFIHSIVRRIFGF